MLRMLALPLLAAPLFALAGDIQYTPIFLPKDFGAHYLGSNGQVVGAVEAPHSPGDLQAAIWSNSQLTLYSTPNTMFNVISPDGRYILGTRDDYIEPNVFFYDNGTETTIPMVPHVWAEANAVNNSGQVAGTLVVNGPQGQNEVGFVYANGQIEYLGLNSGADWRVYDMNAAGVVVGNFSANNMSHAFMYSNGVTTDLGSLYCGDYSFAYGINDAGDIVGMFGTARDEHPFLYSAGTILDLGTLGGTISRANAINNHGQIVGASNTANGDLHAFLYSNGQMLDLSDMVQGLNDWTLMYAYGINDAGQILVSGCPTGGGGCSMLLLEPLTAVPEPSTWALLLAGLGGLAYRFKRRRTASA
ncbi:HAF repeat-containing PEP-CTERM protein [Massilia horti]|nr:HAF repeat-containing PEP-CTERM protein [Massilia horti]